MVSRCQIGAVLFSLAVALAAAPSYANDRCHGVALTEARSLADLPKALRQLLPSAEWGLNGIADRGGRFNVTDAVDHNLPMLRFTLAAVGSTCAVIALEYGGFIHRFELTEYSLTTAGWTLIGRARLAAPPKSLQDLVTEPRAASQ